MEVRETGSEKLRIPKAVSSPSEFSILFMRHSTASCFLPLLVATSHCRFWLPFLVAVSGCRFWLPFCMVSPSVPDYSGKQQIHRRRAKGEEMKAFRLKVLKPNRRLSKS